MKTGSEFTPGSVEENDAKPEIDQRRLTFVAALRHMATILEHNSEIPVPYFNTYHRVESVKEMLAFVKKYGGKWEKSTDATDFNMRHDFGGFTMTVYTARDKVCKRVVTGVKQIPEQTIEATERKIIPAHVEEIVQWVCPESLNEVAKQEDDGHAEAERATNVQ